MRDQVKDLAEFFLHLETSVDNLPLDLGAFARGWFVGQPVGHQKGIKIPVPVIIGKSHLHACPGSFQVQFLGYVFEFSIPQIAKKQVAVPRSRDEQVKFSIAVEIRKTATNCPMTLKKSFQARLDRYVHELKSAQVTKQAMSPIRMSKEQIVPTIPVEIARANPAGMAGRHEMRIFFQEFGLVRHSF